MRECILQLVQGSYFVTTIRLSIVIKMNAELGLFVALSGYGKNALDLAKYSFFPVRHGNHEKLIDQITKNHDNFHDELKAELRLQRIWRVIKEQD